MLIAQVSDPHITADGSPAGNVDPEARLAGVIEVLGAEERRPDLMLVTGDLANDGQDGCYARLATLLEGVSWPVWVLPGNHDDRGGLRAHMGRWLGDEPREDDGFIQYVVDGYALRILVLDTLLDGAAGGRLCGRRLAWLAARLEEERDRPTVIAMHHPPARCGIAGFDKHPMDGRVALEALVRRHPQVVRVVAGHLHRPLTLGWAGSTVTVCPSTAFAVNLDLREGAGLSIHDGAAAFQLHEWLPDGTGLLTHTRALGAL